RDAGYAAKAIDAFNAAYQRKNKFLDPEGTVEAVDWTLVATLPSQTDAAVITHPRAEVHGRRRSRTRRAWFPPSGGYTEALVVDRARLADGGAIVGPAIIEDPDCTTVILPGDAARLSPLGHIVIEIAREASR